LCAYMYYMYTYIHTYIHITRGIPLRHWRRIFSIMHINMYFYRWLVRLWYAHGHICARLHVYICLFTFIYTYRMILSWIVIVIFRHEQNLPPPLPRPLETSYTTRSIGGPNFHFIKILYTSIWIYVHIDIHTSTNMCIHKYMHMYVYIYIYIYVYIYIYMYVYSYTFVCVHVHMYVHVDLYIRII
jgi:hypothetical protein